MLRNTSHVPQRPGDMAHHEPHQQPIGAHHHTEPVRRITTPVLRMAQDTAVPQNRYGSHIGRCPEKQLTAQVFVRRLVPPSQIVVQQIVTKHRLLLE